MIEKKLIPVNGLKKEPFSGSHHGMRYFFCAEESKENFSVFVYPEPWAFDETPEEEKLSSSFPLSDQGMNEAITWLLAQYECQKEKWNTAEKNCMHIIKMQK